MAPRVVTCTGRPEDAKRSTLLTVSGLISADRHDEIAKGRRPRADYDVMAAAFDGDVLDYGAAVASGRMATRALARLAGNDVALAWACFRRRNAYRTMFTDSEKVGMVYAAFCSFAHRRPRHVMIGHRLSASKKVWLHRLLRLGRRIDHVVVYASTQRGTAIEALGYEPERVTLIPFMVDTQFWRQDHVVIAERRRAMICAVGQELRDYATLVDAVSGLDVDVVIAGASPWSKRTDTSADLDIPRNVEVTALGLFDLRQLYAESSLVVVPIQETDFQAGITTILEAMSMGIAVICTRTAGQSDTIIDGVTGRYVPPGNAKALRAAITELLDDPVQARRLGAEGQRWVRTHADIERYATRLATLTERTPP